MIQKFLLAILLLLASLQIQAEPSHAEMVKNSVTAFMEKNQIPGVAVQLYVNGAPTSYYFGYANTAKKTRVTEQTIFEIGSVTKVMTSLLLAEEVDKAKLQLDDSITKYRKELPESLNNITLVSLATHTSGLPFDVDASIKTESALEKFLRTWQPVYHPNENWVYSNFGMGLLGYTLETVTHKNFDQMYRDNILKPLHMTPIALTVPEKLRRDYAQGYNGQNEAVNAVSSSLFPTATSMKATAGDMKRFLAAAIGLPGTPQNILYPMRMTQTGYVKLREGEYQGLGWQIHLIPEDDASNLLNIPDKDNLGPIATQSLDDKPIFNGEALIDKTGSTYGFHSYIALIPNKKSGIVILTNKYIDNGELVKLGRQILLQLTGENVTRA